MRNFKFTLRRIILGIAFISLLFTGYGTAIAETNNLFVTAVTLDADQNVELSPGDPISYTVTFGREVASGTETHGSQQTRVSVYLSSDGNPDNLDNFLLDFFNEDYRGGESARDDRSTTLINRLPPNYTGTYFLVAVVRVTGGAADSSALNDIPSVLITGASRVTIRPVDSATVSRVSVATQGGDSNEFSESGTISSDGRYIVFQSEATDLVQSPVAPTGVSQIYIRDTVLGQTSLVSQRGGVAGNGESRFPSLSVAGLDQGGARQYFVAYQSAATNLVGGTGNADTNQQTDVFLYDVATGVTSRISLPSGSAPGLQPNGGSFLPSISGNGGFVVFESDASNLVASGATPDTNGQRDIFLYNRSTKVVSALSTTVSGVFGSGASTQAQISEDGSTAVFRSYARNLSGSLISPASPRSVIYAKTLSANPTTGSIQPISVLREAIGAGVATYTAFDADAFDPSVSANGRYVAFASRSTNLPNADGALNTDAQSQVYVVNRALTGGAFDLVGNVALTLVSAGRDPDTGGLAFGDFDSLAPTISGNGRYIGYRTEASNLQVGKITRSDGVEFVSDDVAGFVDDNNTSDVYLRDTGVISISVVAAGSGYPTGSGIEVTITGGGGTGARALAIIENGKVSRIDMLDSGSGYSSAPSVTIPAIGETRATAVAVIQIASERMSVSQFGQQTTGLIGSTLVPSSRDLKLSSDGRYILFTSDAANNAGFIFGKSNQRPLDSNGKRDIFLVDRKVGTYVTPIEGSAPTISVSVDGRPVSFGSSRVIRAQAFDGGDFDDATNTAVSGKVQLIEIYANNQLLKRYVPGNPSSVESTSATWLAPLSSGAVQIYAIVEDSDGNRVRSQPVNIVVSPPPSLEPTITLRASASTLNIGQALTLTATASDPDNGVKAVRFYGNGSLIATVTSAPYVTTFSPSTSGTYEFLALVYDNSAGGDLDTDPIELARLRNTELSNAVNALVLAPPAPTVQLVSPSAATTTTIGSSVFIEISAESNNSQATISTVEVFTDGQSIGTAARVGFTSRYRLTWRPAVAGVFSLSAVATDTQQSRSTSALSAVTVNSVVGSVPIVVITSPVVAPAFGYATLYTSETTTVQMQALDLDGTVSSVELYISGRRLGVAARNGANFELLVDGKTTPTGLYELVALATDNAGNIASSAKVAVLVAARPAAITILRPTVPLSGSPLIDVKRGQPVAFLFNATTPDSLTRVTQVSLSVNGVTLPTAAIAVGTQGDYTLSWTPDSTGIFTLVAIATDSVGGTVRSSELEVRVTEPVGTAPEVRVIAPASTGGTNPVPASATIGSQVLFVASATDNTGVTAVNFYADGVLLPGLITRQGTTNQWVLNATLSGAPFSTKGVGSYAITAIASDADLNQTQSSAQSLNVTLGSPAAAPTVTLTGPAAGIINQTVLFSALPVAATSANVSRVEFFMNGLSAGSDTTAPYTLSYTGTVSGNYIVYAVVTDSLGNSVVSSAQSYTVSSATAPTITLTPSASSVTLGSTLIISAAAADADGTVDLVVFKEYYGSLSATPNRTVEDRIAPYSYVFNPTLTGSYLIVAEATDNQGNVTSSATQLITVLANAVIPVVSFNSPDAGSTLVVGQDTTLDVSVSVATGASVNQVNFYANGLLIGTGAQQGVLNRYRFVWQPSVTGVFTLSADAVDSFGGRGETSPTRTVSVINQTGSLPFVEIIQPVAPATTTGTNAATINTTSNSDLNLVASAVDSDGSISAVEFFLDRGRSAVATAGITFPSAIVNGAALQSTTGYINGITVTDAGAGYLSPPVVKIVGDGNGATAEAELTNGAISRIRITNKGAGYTNAIVRFEGGGLTNGLSMGLATHDFDSNSWRLPTPYNFKNTGAGVYTFRAVARDNNNNVQTSAAVVVTVTPAPLNTPTSGTVVSTPATSPVVAVPAGQNVQLSISPSVVGGSVASVEFLANGVSIGTDTGSPYIINWIPAFVGNYNVLAVVTDSVGNKAVSAVLPVYVGGNIAPTITLIRPELSGSTGVVNQPVLLEAEAFAPTPGATISTVEFNADGVSLGIANQVGVSSRYVLSDWKPSTAKPYLITARVVDSFGQAALSSARTINVTVQSGVIPTVVLTAPSGGGTGGTTGGLSVSNNSGLFLSAQANDADGTVANVEFLVTRGQRAIARLGGTNSNDTGLTYFGGINSISISSGGSGYLYAPRVKIIGSGVGASAEATVSNGAVTSIRILSPGTGYTSTLQILIEGGGLYENLVVGAATHNVGTLTWSSSIDLRSYDVGPYFFSARVTDNLGNTSISSTAAVTLNAATAGAPSVTLAVPASNLINLGQASKLVANPIAATSASIAKVDFFANGLLIGTATSSPYQYNYTAPSSGVYVIYAVVTDDTGNTSVSSAQTLTVLTAVPPVVSISAPSNTVALGSTLEISATATDADGTVTEVVFDITGAGTDSFADRNSPYVFEFKPTKAGIYSIRAQAKDNMGNTADSTPLSILVTPTSTKPTVEIISPVAGTTAVVGQSTTLEASVTVGNGVTVNEVNFYANGALIGPGAQQGQLNRYRVNWQPSVTGPFQLTAEVVDSYGVRGETTNARLVTVVAQSGALPSVQIIQPVTPSTTNGGTPSSLTTTANSDINLAASAMDSDGTINSVEFLLNRGRPATATATVKLPSAAVNGAALQQTTGTIGNITVTDGGTGYLYPPQVSIVGDGNDATAVAEIQNGAVSTIRITSPGFGYTNASVRLVGGGFVENLSIGFAVRDFASDVWRLATPFNFKSYGAGFFTFRAVAKDNNNNAQSSDAVSVTVSSAPLTTPVTGNVVSTPATSDVNGQRVPAGQSVQLALNPTVVGGSVASVEFFANGVSVGIDKSPPYIVNWVPSYVGSYNVIAVVTDSVGNQGVSPASPVYVGGNIAPTIELIRPSIVGTTGVVNQAVLLEAEATALTPGATIATVEFNADGESVGIASQVGVSNRYVLSTWRPISAKTYSITARAVDSFGQSVLTQARGITVQTQSGVIPTVLLTAPANSGGGGSTTGGLSVSNNSALFLSAQANDADGSVANVEFLISRGQQASAAFSLWSSSFYQSGYIINQGIVNVISGGSGYLYAPRVKIVGNGNGATAEAVISNGAVTSVKIISMGSGYTYPPQFVFEGGGLYENLVVDSPATHNPGTLTWSSSVDLRTYDVGPYFFSARVTDNQGNTAISSATAVTVTAATAGAPSVSLAVPSPTSVSLGQTTNLVATPVVSTGATITKVDFYANGSSIGTSSAKPYLLAYTAPASGVYTVYAVVTDSTGNTAVSSAQTVTVTALIGVAPTVTVQAPTAPLTTASVYPFRATATDSDGTIAPGGVEFYLDGESVGLGVYDSTSATWVSPLVSFVSKIAGTYSLSAVAIDNANNRSSSAVVPITITTSTVAGAFGTSLNELFFAGIGRNATDLEHTAYLRELGANATDYEIAAVLMQSAAFDTTGAVVINAYRAVFGEYPTYTAYQNGLIAISGGTAAYIDSLYASGEYLAKFGRLPAFSVLKNRETFSSTVHANLTGSVPSSKIKGAALTASSLNLSAVQLAEARKQGTSEKALVTAAFAGLTTQSAGTVVARYIVSLSGTTEIPLAVLSRARVAGIILALTEPATALSFRETDGLRSFFLLDVAELYGTGTTDAAIKPIFRTFPASQSVALGSELKFTAVVISPAVFTATSDISSKWTFNSRTTLTIGSNSTSSPPEHIVSYTIPNALSTNAGGYTLAVSNRFGTVTAPTVTASITPIVPTPLPGTVALKVGVPYPSSAPLGLSRPGMSYVVKNLPNGLRFSSATGVISGTPTRAGSYTVSYYTTLGKLTSVTQRSNFIVAK